MAAPEEPERGAVLCVMRFTWLTHVRGDTFRDVQGVISVSNVGSRDACRVPYCPYLTAPRGPPYARPPPPPERQLQPPIRLQRHHARLQPAAGREGGGGVLDEAVGQVAQLDAAVAVPAGRQAVLEAGRQEAGGGARGCRSEGLWGAGESRGAAVRSMMVSRWRCCDQSVTQRR